MSKYAPCPSFADLLANGAVNVSLEAHVAECPRCSWLRATMPAAEAPAAPDAAGNAAARSDGPTPLAPVLGGGGAALEPGQIVVATYADLDEFLLAVVLESAGGDPTVAPLGDNPVLATELDLLLDQVFLGYPAVAQAWNTGLLLAEQVHDVIGQLPADDLRALEALIAAAQGVGAMSDDLPTGAPVLGENDPRLAARDEARERVTPFWRPAALLAESPTFGALIRDARAREDVADHELADLLNVPSWLERLEGDRLDLQVSLPIRTLVRLLDRLHVGLHEGTARLVGAAVAATCTPPPRQELRLARRRTGSARAFAPSPEDRRAAAQRYVEALWREAGPR